MLATTCVGILGIWKVPGIVGSVSMVVRYYDACDHDSSCIGRWTLEPHWSLEWGWRGWFVSEASPL
ncbi:MAG: hypothetical protein HXK09_03040 [Actinomyces bouchesdurhonensis]|uniref:Uncharacterized protein n=1 Tax=Actinomyces bouchesdurhonensis TaxID=1852361 RepID=A0A929RPS3_9ACTO|nr:hypothetical protein [Actinomyces bouchesdurhonensis]